MAVLNVRDNWSFTGYFLYSDSWIVTTPDNECVVLEENFSSGYTNGAQFKHVLDNGSKSWILTIKQGQSSEKNHVLPALNRLAAIPLLGSIAGALRIALASLHIVGHFFMTLLRGCSGSHFAHTIKGGAELLRGIIELLPVLGVLFVRWFDVRNREQYIASHRDSLNPAPLINYSFFLIKAYSWGPDMIDYKVDAYRPSPWILSRPTLPMRYREPYAPPPETAT